MQGEDQLGFMKYCICGLLYLGSYNSSILSRKSELFPYPLSFFYLLHQVKSATNPYSPAQSFI